MPRSKTAPEVLAYLTGPQSSSRGIVVLHDFFGVTEYTRAWAEHLGELGARVAVLDLYGGKSTGDREIAAQWMRQVDPQRADYQMRTAVRWLCSDGRRLAALGWSFGARQALRLAMLEPEHVVATVMYYGRTVNDPDELSRLSGPVQIIYATQEQGWAENRNAFERAMEAAGKLVESHAFDAGHGFVNPDSPRYDVQRSEAAFALTRRFLCRYLR